MADTIGFGDLQNQGQDDQNKKDQQGQQQASTDQSSQQPTQSQVSQAGQSGGTGAQDLGQYKPEAYSQQKQGTGYTNIQKVLQANTGSGIGQTIGGNIQQAGQKAASGIQQAGQQFQQQTQANQFGTPQNQQIVQQVLADPSSYVNQAANSTQGQAGSQFQQLISGQYGGPTDLANAQQLQQQTQSAQKLGQATGSQAGQMGLLQQYFGSPQYQAGQQNLDALLLGQTGQPALRQARQATSGLGQQLSTTQAGAQAQGAEQTALAKQFGTDVQGQLGTTVGGIDTGLQSAATTAQTARDTQFQQMQDALKSGKISQQEADLLGIAPGETLYSNQLQNPSAYLQEDKTQATAQNIASAQDYARIQALQKLSGQNAPTSASDVFSKYTDPTQAGTYAAAQGITGLKDAFQQQATAAQQAYATTVPQAQQGAQEALKIRNWAYGELTPAETAEATQLYQQTYGTKAPAPDSSTLGQTLWKKYYGGQGGNAGNLDARWAIGNLNQKQAAQQQAEQQFNTDYGSATPIQIIPQG